MVMVINYHIYVKYQVQSSSLVVYLSIILAVLKFRDNSFISSHLLDFPKNVL